VFRAASPGSPALPTRHSRPSRSATSLAGLPSSDVIVTTTISPPDFSRTSVMTRSISTRRAAGITFAKSLM
jgi:hypothetical protein